jgi:hypothetical protein
MFVRGVGAISLHSLAQIAATSMRISQTFGGFACGPTSASEGPAQLEHVVQVPYEQICTLGNLMDLARACISTF